MIKMKYLNLKDYKKIAIFTLSLCIIGLSSMSAHAKAPRSEEQIKKEDIALRAAIQQGDKLWHSPELGSNGLACANCHGDASATNPHTWPKYQTNLGKVSTMREMINWCIAVPLQGLPLDLDSTEMVAMESYATHMHSGVPIAMGADEQHGGIPVVAGAGYKEVSEEEMKLALASSNVKSSKTIGDLELGKESGCLACHAINEKLVGPPWALVSKKYRDDPKARAFLINKVAKGGNGNWNDLTGGFKMPANFPKVSMGNIELMVDFVLSLDKNKSATAPAKKKKEKMTKLQTRQASIRPKDYVGYTGNLSRAELVAKGKKLHADTSLGTSGGSCDTCHSETGFYQESFAKDYPHPINMAKNKARYKKAVHADEFVNFCVVVPMKGDPLPWDSEELAALTAYVEDVKQREYRTKKGK